MVQFTNAAAIHEAGNHEHYEHYIDISSSGTLSLENKTNCIGKTPRGQSNLTQWASIGNMIQFTNAAAIPEPGNYEHSVGLYIDISSSGNLSPENKTNCIGKTPKGQANLTQ